jgi:hypothetical protein
MSAASLGQDFGQLAAANRLIEALGDAVAGVSPGPAPHKRVAAQLVTSDVCISKVNASVALSALGDFRLLRLDATMVGAPPFSAEVPVSVDAPDADLDSLSAGCDDLAAFTTEIDAQAVEDAALAATTAKFPAQPLQVAFSLLMLCHSRNGIARPREWTVWKNSGARPALPAICVRDTDGICRLFNPTYIFLHGLNTARHIAWSRDWHAAPNGVVATMQGEVLKDGTLQFGDRRLTFTRLPAGDARNSWKRDSTSRLQRLASSRNGAHGVLLHVDFSDAMTWLPHELRFVAESSPLAVDLTGAAVGTCPQFASDMLAVAAGSASVVVLPPPQQAPGLWNTLLRLAEFLDVDLGSQNAGPAPELFQSRAL